MIFAAGMRHSFFALLVFFWALFAVYSYAFLDVNLTLSSWNIYQSVQQSLFQLGYFQRNISAGIYVMFLIILFGLYIFALRLVLANKLSEKAIWKISSLVSGILVFAYPAFSHDIFNYMFYGRIITLYQGNPYTLRALDFPDDLWVRFMRWTHGVAPYGVVLLALTVVPSFFGFGKFIPTLLFFKLLMFGGYILCLYSLRRILRVVAPSFVNVGLVLFGLNPLVLVEGIVNGHNDLVFMGFALLGLAFLLEKRMLWAWVFLMLSIGTKYATAAFVLPFFLIQRLHLAWSNMWWMLLGLMMLAVVIASMGIYNRGSTGGEFLPWYLLWPICIAVLRPQEKMVWWMVVSFSLGGLLYYVPYILTGVYTDEVKIWRMFFVYMPAIFVLVSLFVLRWKHEK
ncbi:MAG: hypothetical protein Q8R11_00985 [bacterium]|nr:hypothetical protein [bacterium]